MADAWPEFAAHGKHEVTLRHVLLHTAAVPGLPADTTVEDLCNWEHMCAVLADSKPWWKPGTRFGYHALTLGFLAGDMSRRATRRDVPSLRRGELTAPLGIEDDVHFGVPDAALSRGATAVGPVGPLPEPPAPGSPMVRAMPRAVLPDADLVNRDDVLAADIPSFGPMTARSVARMYAALFGQVDVSGWCRPDDWRAWRRWRLRVWMR